MYYQLCIPVTEDYGVTEWGKVANSAAQLTSGTLVIDPIDEDLKVIVSFTTAYPPTDVISTYIPIMSAPFVEALKRAGVDNLQLYPVRLENKDLGITWDNFYIVNILGLVACADLKLSTGTPLLSSYNFRKLVIDVEKAKGALCFRLLEASNMIIVHYEVAKQMFTAQNEPRFRGIEFKPIPSSPKQ